MLYVCPVGGPPIEDMPGARCVTDRAIGGPPTALEYSKSSEVGLLCINAEIAKYFYF